MDTKIILVRHGESEWNNDSGSDRYNGLTDISLNLNGIKQAESMGLYLKDMIISAFYCSPLKRSVETAEKVLHYHSGKQLIICKELTEMNFGDWEGYTRTELSNTYHDLYNSWEKNPDCLSPPGGETGNDVLLRAMPFISNLETKHHEGTVFIAAHKNLNRIVLASLFGIHLKFFRNYIPQRVGALNIIYLNNGKLSKVEKIDDLSYKMSQNG